jgi:UDP-hydrolysing UDP-N-acetyl-D-glucosamine 2-epimerase
MKKRTIAVFTGNRAEYGLQFPILRAIDNHPSLEYRLLVSGAHLDHNFGSTLEEIKRDGFHVDKEIKIDMDAGSLFATAQAIGSGIIDISKALSEIEPDIMLVYADRFEGFAAVIAATQMNIPTAHVEGGDLTEGGALDDSVRHAMTKLSHLHFTSNEQSTNRILAMGEEHWRVKTVGLPVIDLIEEKNYALNAEITEKLNLDLSKPIVLFTQHSVSTQFQQAGFQIEHSLDAIQRLASDGIQVVLTFPNNDAGGQEIVKKLNDFKSKNIPNTQIRQSLGRYLYHGILALARDQSIRIACVGNSSSGLKETPAFGCPTVNIGSRQNGRLRGTNVLESNYSSDEIYFTVRRALFDNEFRNQCQIGINPYWRGGAGPKIAEVLSSIPINENLTQKRMNLKGKSQNGWFQ